MPDTTSSGASVRTGALLAAGAYGIWGFLPLYFHALKDVPPVQMLCWRILFSLVLCAILLSATRSWGTVRTLLRRRRVVLTLGLAGLVVSVNWLVYIMATTTGHVLEASLGYFINPIATIVLGVLVLRERLRPLQWIAVGCSALAVVVLAVENGRPPWMSLLIATSFALYGLVKKNLGGRVGALTGLTFETAWLAVPAAVVLLVLAAGQGTVFQRISTGQGWLLAASGLVTAVPLLFFAGAASRLPLTLMGMFQYWTPIAQFAIGYWVLGEPMSAARWAGFGIVWLAVALLVLDGLRSAGLARRATRLARRQAQAPGR